MAKKERKHDVIGAGIGVLASFGLTRFIESMLFGVTATDPLLACLIPALRVMRVDPIFVLRHS